jgi:hypothetical protein
MGSRKARRLAAAGGGVDQQVTPLQGKRNGLQLHGRGGLEAHLVDGFEEALVKLKIGKHRGRL